MKEFIRQRLSESLTSIVIESLLDEDYPKAFNMDEFKTLDNFNDRIKYCEANLKRIASGTSRIVYMIDDQKVLKLAKNNVGLSQNNTEISYRYYNDPVLAKCFDFHPKDLWVEMELAQGLNKTIFKQIVGLKWENYAKIIHHYGVNGYLNNEFKIMAQDNTFVDEMTSFIGSHGLPIGDLIKLDSYGVVNRDSRMTVVLIDYGLDNQNYQSYYA